MEPWVDECKCVFVCCVDVCLYLGWWVYTLYVQDLGLQWAFVGTSSIEA